MASTRTLPPIVPITAGVSCGDSVNFIEGSRISIQWNAVPGVRVYAIKGILTFREWNALGDTLLRTHEWISLREYVVSPLLSGGSLQHSLSGDDMLGGLTKSFQNTDSTTRREVISVEAQLTGADEALYDFARSADAGLQTKEVPTYYTNVSGGVGVLGARTSYYCSYLLTQNTKAYFAERYRSYGFR